MPPDGSVQQRNPFEPTNPDAPPERQEKRPNPSLERANALTSEAFTLMSAFLHLERRGFVSDGVAACKRWMDLCSCGSHLTKIDSRRDGWEQEEYKTLLRNYLF
ncbi:hypothetical protein CDAR_206951 [Caerostris darwini]|uniref:Uncharacterized protein n=1 Tax=Caerostris darwini TaxID=1538125 RepID=A0AAV4SRH3_9ARAC|nr:hypothetical protein CDAR_206951 [Caerostris darwini]